MNIDFPYHFDGCGRTAATDDDDHIRDMIEQLLFTSPGERVNRPDFGSGLLQMVFAPNSPELAAALQYTTQAALQRYLGDVIDLQSLEVTAQDSTLSVVVKYVVKRTGDARTENIEKANVVLSGGRRIRDVQIKAVRVQRQPDPTLDDYLEVRVNKAGDFSNYTISLVKTADGQPTSEPMDKFDPRYDEVSFSFKANCPTDLDCKPPCTCPPPQRKQPDIDYLAKDYESFRELILDRLALIMPEWTETHAPDFGFTLVELLAYAGDYLSYYQDAVATEAYLGTARQRISVRRHARLVDYQLSEGCNARAWVCVEVDD